MKRFVSVLLSLALTLSMCTGVFARTIAESSYFVPNPLELGLTVTVSARDSANGAYVPNSLELTDVNAHGESVDYKTTLNMEPIRALYDEGFMQDVFTTDEQVRNEFNAALVSSTISVIIEYPATAIVQSGVDLTSPTVGILDAGSIFSETSRTLSGNKLTINYTNRNTLSAQELMTHKNDYLKDITFTLEDTVTYVEAGAHRLSVTLSGSTTFNFASKNQVVNYNGQASHIVNVTRANITNHILDIVPAVLPTCTESGWTEGIICKTCNSYDCGAEGTIPPESISPLGHSKVSFPYVAATCSSYGINAHYTCSVCKANFDTAESNIERDHDYYVIPKSSVHRNSAVTTIEAATCAASGYTSGSFCLDCGAMTSVPTVLPKLSHNEAHIVAVGSAIAPTCTEDGLTAGKKCGDCNTVIEPQKVVAATGHSFGDWVVTNPTATSDGSKVRTCGNCGTTETIIIPKPEHQNHVADPDRDNILTAPTCTTDGLKEVFCDCGHKIGEVTIPKLGHKLSHVSAVAATCVDKGVIEHYLCSVCNEKFRDASATKKLNSTSTSKDKTNHIEIETLKGYAATCSHQGLTDGTICRACNTVIEKQSKIPILTDAEDHTFSIIAEIPATCESDGVIEHKHCTVCDLDFAMDGTTKLSAKDLKIRATGHNYGPAEKKDPEVITPDGNHFEGIKTCQNHCGKTITVKMPRAEICDHTTLIDNHETSTLVTTITRQPTCLEVGKAVQICSICGVQEGEEFDIEKIAHQYEWIPQVDSTCNKQGTEGHYTCKVCDKLFNSSKVEITEPRKLDLITEHNFRSTGANVKTCHFCGEVVKLSEKGSDGTNRDLGVTLVKPDHIKQTEEDVHAEEAIEEISNVTNVETLIEVSEREETSDRIEEKIEENKPTAETTVEKLTFDITVEKAVYYEGLEIPVTIPYKETEGLVGIKIDISGKPAIQSARSIIVYRHHNDGATDHWDEIRESNDVTRERVEVASDRSYITLYVNKFSEYAIAAYSTQVPETPIHSSTPGGSSSLFNIKLNANGGTVVGSVSVTGGSVAKLPVPTRDGYIFAGWYLDSELTKLFDVNTKVNKNFTLYAKWTMIGECEGTVEDNCPCLNFFDLDPNEWYHVGVDYVLNRGMMIGVEVDEFAPNENVTRAMLVTVLYRAEGQPATNRSIPFADIESGSYYENAVIWAEQNGIVKGYSDTEFAPNDFISREQFAAIVYRYANFLGYDVSVGENTNILSYEDYDDISEYAIPAMQYTAGSGLIKGRTETTLNPTSYTTRAEMATILYRFFTSNK